MANMSYCRFENTSNDLTDCVRAMVDMQGSALEREESYADLSITEKQALQQMIATCEQFMKTAHEIMEQADRE